MLAPSTIISARFHGWNQRESIQSVAGWGQGAGESVPGAERGLEAVTCVRADTEKDTTRAADQFRTPAERRDGRYLASAYPFNQPLFIYVYLSLTSLPARVIPMPDIAREGQPAGQPCRRTPGDSKADQRASPDGRGDTRGSKKPPRARSQAAPREPLVASAL
ncbi:hypothetical protein HPB47_022840 [Ixodes persulcatus]|uniref:Uncharacterized protein n=1 Tax=Ixodes persulcatus TaxID=34615 RepID=A0AC60Q9D5_IXOPE|nr:hypothetical protein HPB47_022840 [Ixodes persulcatus]